MENKDKQILQKIYSHVISVLKYCVSCNDLTEFQEDSMRVEACVFNFMQIGELAKTAMSNETKVENCRKMSSGYMEKDVAIGR